MQQGFQGLKSDNCVLFVVQDFNYHAKCLEWLMPNWTASKFGLSFATLNVVKMLRCYFSKDIKEICGLAEEEILPIAVKGRCGELLELSREHFGDDSWISVLQLGSGVWENLMSLIREHPLLFQFLLLELFLKPRVNILLSTRNAFFSCWKVDSLEQNAAEGVLDLASQVGVCINHQANNRLLIGT